MISSALVLKCVQNIYNFYLKIIYQKLKYVYFNQLMYMSCLWWTRLQKNVREDGIEEENQGVENSKNKVYVKTVIMKPNIFQDSFEKLKVTIIWTLNMLAYRRLQTHFCIVRYVKVFNKMFANRMQEYRKDDHPQWSGWLYPRDAKMDQHTQSINLITHINWLKD